ncbi:hypothetical protein [Devosia submarina]|uniref:hypothetical protein n=1 Tax=Devosia submarina TaxID=1173082 RepID=UPI001300A942|nr:hypothetical protein [Devosia submarina]
MNLSWNSLTPLQQRALAALSQLGTSPLPSELAEQLYSLGLVEPVDARRYCMSLKGSTVLPPTIH